MSVRSRLFGPPAPKMPPGLIDLMDGLARDVLKNNPDNIYEFCARHMHTLLEIRDGYAPKPFLALEQKIVNAQKKVKQRAEQRHQEYDKKIRDNVENEQMLLSATVTPCYGDDITYCEKKDMEKITNDVAEEERKEINVTEEYKSENPIQLNSTDINIKASDNEEVMENQENENNSDNTVLKGSDENEKYNITKDAQCLAEDAYTDGHIKNNQSQEIQNIAISSNIIQAVKDNVSESLSEDPVVKLAPDDNTEEKIIAFDKDNGANEQSENSAKIQNDSETIIPRDPESEINADKTENVDNTSQIHDNSARDTEQFKKPIDDPTVDESLKEACGETNLINEAENNFIQNRSEFLNDNDKSHDDKIFAVILDSENIDPTPLENNERTDPPNETAPVQVIEPELLKNNECDQNKENGLDVESGPESTNNLNSSMDLETAAVTIQKVFRSFLFKTKTASYDDSTTLDISMLTQDKDKEENELLNIKDRRSLGISRMDTVLQTVNEEKSLSLSTDDSSTLSSAATVIQAHVRGFLVRNKLNLNKTISSNSQIDSDALSIPSLEADSDSRKNKTVLNIHIVPEGGHFVSRDESILTSMDLSLDSSPSSSVNLHPLGYDKSERRKQLKREDAIQSVSPPSNNSGKLSEEHDSVKEAFEGEIDKSPIEVEVMPSERKSDSENENPTSDAASDEMDVITPFVDDKRSREFDNSSKLLHSGEFHDIVVPTNVTRSDTSVVREFQNVLVYFILWNN